MAFPYSQLYSPTTNGSITATQYNAEHQNHINNNIPESIDDYMASVAEMRLQTDPGEIGTESQATSLSEELERLRYAIKEAKNMWGAVTYWYETPTVGNLTKTSNADAFTVYAQNASYSSTILTLKTDEENSGSFYYVKFQSDTDGTPTTDFSVNQDGDVVCGAITAAGAINGATISSGTVSTGTGTLRTTDLLLYETTAGTGNAITIACPSTPSAWTLTLPTNVPGSASFMQFSTGGVASYKTADEIGSAMTSTGANAIAAARTRATGTTVAAGGVAISSQIDFSTTSASFTSVTNATVTITTSGRPVRIFLQPDLTSSGTGDAGYLSVLGDSTANSTGWFQVMRDGVSKGVFLLDTSGHAATSEDPNMYVPPGCVDMLDVVAAGTYTYTLRIRIDSGDTIAVGRCNLVAYEI